MADFTVKFPVFQLGEAHRGVLLSAKVRVDGYADVTLLTDDGKGLLVVMPMSRVTEAVQRGPYVVLVEVKNVGGEQVRGVGILGPDGQPL
jgi:hypothetical protein